ncbi:MAG: glycoside hydrolase family 99-like domain-containing protein, partial [Clostridia bacterium]|nr:glycoside hydrolase family 99-like domain-containing protein [Clostridia bacterium]
VVKEAGFPDLHIQGVIYSENAVNISGVDSEHKGSSKDLVRLLGLDSVTHYQYIHFAEFSKGYEASLPGVAAEFERIHNEYNVPYYPHVTVGWDNNPRYPHIKYPIVKDNTPEMFKRALKIAKDYSDNYNDVPLITVNSWNEWTEMSYLEPDDVYGYGYLEAIKEVFCDE